MTAFFALSGFLMTLLMDTTYRNRIGAFAINRFLRLYPTYWFTMLLMAGLILAGLPASRKDIGVPPLEELAVDILYIVRWDDNPQLVLTAWAVTNEMIFYALIAFGISRTPNRALAWLAVSVGITAALRTLTSGAGWQYFSPLAASLPFALGSVAYHYRHLVATKHVRPIGAFCVVVLLISAWASLVMDSPAGNFVFLGAATILTIVLFQIKASSRMIKVDDWIGRLSYPMYLNHFGAAMIVMALFAFPRSGAWTPVVRSNDLVLTVCAVSIVLSVVTYHLVDKPVNSLRSALRRGTLGFARPMKP